MKATDSNVTFHDPVCGMTVNEDSVHRYEHGGVVHRFCSSGCLEKYKADPARFPEKA
ncbi:MAG: YHS domain-containing protein [Candidatus Eisenbacteria bacterium]